MPAITKTVDLDDLVLRYQAGEPIYKLAAIARVAHKRLRAMFIEAGVEVRSIRTNLTVPGFRSIVARYMAGETEQSLAAELGINRGSLRLRLKRAGVKCRTISDAMKTRWERADKAARQQMLDPAHAATRGRTPTIDERMRRATTRELRQVSVGASDRWLVSRLRRAGLSVTMQKAEWVYNIDLAVNEPRIAVEIFGGQWHGTGAHASRHHRRTKHLLDQGWSVIVIWVDSGRYPLGPGAVKYVLAHAQELRRNPAASRQYRVILGDGETAPMAASNLNTRAIVKRLGCA